jgi:hypothetical protein
MMSILIYYDFLRTWTLIIWHLWFLVFIYTSYIKNFLGNTFSSTSLWILLCWKILGINFYYLNLYLSFTLLIIIFIAICIRSYNPFLAVVWRWFLFLRFSRFVKDIFFIYLLLCLKQWICISGFEIIFWHFIIKFCHIFWLICMLISNLSKELY